MKKVLTALLTIFTFCFMTGAVLACGADCECGCQQGKECTCKKEAKCDCGCEKTGECKCSKDCKCGCGCSESGKCKCTKSKC